MPSQPSVLVEVLKKALRGRGVTYRGVAEAVGLSESSVKRLFATGNMSVSRLEQICAVAGLELAELLEVARAGERRPAQLTEEQERALAADARLLLVALLACTDWTIADMRAVYRLDEPELTRLLARLDRLKILDFLPGERIRPRLARNVVWRKGGPIQRFFEERVQHQFFESSFEGDGELRVVAHASLSARSNRLLQGRMRRLAEEMHALAEEDRRLGRDLCEGTSLVVALRPWELGLFRELRRERKAAAPRRVRGSASSWEKGSS